MISSPSMSIRPSAALCRQRQCSVSYTLAGCIPSLRAMLAVFCSSAAGRQSRSSLAADPRLLHKRAKVHHLVGHQCLLEFGWCSQPDPADESSMTTRDAARSLQRYVARPSRAASLPPDTSSRWTRPGSGGRRPRNGGRAGERVLRRLHGLQAHPRDKARPAHTAVWPTRKASSVAKKIFLGLCERSLDDIFHFTRDPPGGQQVPGVVDPNDRAPNTYDRRPMVVGSTA